MTRSPLMLRLLEQARMVAQSDVSVLINGQSGTGKRYWPGYPQSQPERKTVYRHQLWCTAGAVAGIRAVRPCQRCLYRRGEQPGRAVPAAESGTLFLDEIGDMPMPLQVKLLRVLQERKVRPLGSNRDIDIDVRVISATHRDLPKAMEKHEFREDLYYRLNVVNLKIPTLHERAEDIPLLANHILREAAKNISRLSAASLRMP